MDINYRDFLQEIYNKPSRLSEAYTAFHDYSLANQWLATAQMVAPEPIATYKQWVANGRQVRRGERAIELLVPLTFKTENEEGESYTPEAVPDFDIEKALETLGVTKVTYTEINGNCQGYAIPSKKTIAVNPLAENPFKTTCHEMAHCLLHGGEGVMTDGGILQPSEGELEAEGTAYLVSLALGLTKGLEKSRGYIQHWLAEDNVNEEHFKRIFTTATKILAAGR